ncbi:uncharacterized protein EI90DRAFT_3119190 [Cantharellus anzutake]|uniref:uncharacterized protein n=1 Tax=Cantharellus anzutake TaxID=1750568 RepID=UPI00190680F2|nr:uncharacterized protein EI90DRAFT_3119190 [Cantharellus anzutake]KAF8336866.1 hypothetical protein EI90DRAFT_3119190 [Cantharellus anzutake]
MSRPYHYYEPQDLPPSPYPSSGGGHEADGTDSNVNYLNHNSSFNVSNHLHFDLLRGEQKAPSRPQEYLGHLPEMAQRETGRLPQAPKYINDFSKALASEVRILLQEVGKLRDERRALQFEIAQLMAMKSQHGPGGEFAPHWKPEQPEALFPPPPEPAPAPPEPVEPPAPAKSGWRTVEQPRKRERKPRKNIGGLPEPVSAPVPPPFVEVKPSWASWKPNPQLLAPTRVPAAPVPIPAPMKPGLFGPGTP